MKFFSSVAIAVAAMAACADANAHDKKTRAQRTQGKPAVKRSHGVAEHKAPREGQAERDDRYHHQQHPEGKTKKGQLRAPPLPELRVSPSVGSKNVVVVRIKTIDNEPTSSSAVLSDKVFGTHGDKQNMKSQFSGCSHGKFQISTGTGPGIVDGVAEVDLTDMASEGVECDVLSSAAEDILNSRWGTSDWTQTYDFMMFVCPKGALDEGDSEWVAYATGRHKTYYSDNEVLIPATQMHEIGHNLWLNHANEDGKDNYEDATGVMGNAEDAEEGRGAKACFNPAKSWQLGWYRDKSITVNPKTSGEHIIKIVGVNNYNEVTGDDKVILKVSGNDGQDYFIGFNHADGFNAGTFEAANQVTVVQQEVPDDDAFLSDEDHELPSNLNAKLGPGESYTTETGVVIKVIEVDTTSKTGHAKVQICAANSCSDTPTETTIDDESIDDESIDDDTIDDESIDDESIDDESIDDESNDDYTYDDTVYDDTIDDESIDDESNDDDTDTIDDDTNVKRSHGVAEDKAPREGQIHGDFETRAQRTKGKPAVKRSHGAN